MDNTEERIRQLLGKNTWTTSEKEEIQSLVAKNHQDVDKLTTILQEYFENDLEQGLKSLNPDRSQILLTRIHNRMEISVSPVHRVHFLRRGWFKYAAAIIIIFGAGAYLWTTNKKTDQTLANGNKQLQSDVAPGRDRAILTLANGQQIMLDSTQGNIVKKGDLTVVNFAGKLKYEGVGTNAEYNTISTPKGGQYQIVLPDGSKVWLNAASSIKFPTAFTGNARYVEMTGEAYMEIARNSKQAFMVTANGAEIQVLGTSFNVNAYEDESAVKTTLISGSVKVVKVGQSTVLKPGQQAIASSHRQLEIISNPDLDQTIAWKDGIFNFRGLDLKSAMRQLERWYDLKVQYKGTVSDDLIFEGKMYRSVNLSSILKMLRETGVKLELEGKTLVVL